MADRDELKSRLSAFGELPLPSRLHMFSDTGNRESQNIEDRRGTTVEELERLYWPAATQGQIALMSRLLGQMRDPPWRKSVGEHIQGAGNMLPDLDLRRNFAEGGTVDNILSAYSAPVRSWPGEQALDDEARANYAAMHPEPKKLRPEETYRGTFLPFRETTEGKHEWAVPGIFMDPADAAKAIHASSGTSLGAMARPSQLSPEALDEILGIGGAGALTGIMGNMPRVLAKPSAGATELGIFGGRRGAENLALAGDNRPLHVLDMLEAMEKAGASRDEIWAATNKLLEDSPYAGAFRGSDKKPRFEIDDSKSELTLMPKPRGMMHGEYGDILMHDLLSEAYPSVSGYSTLIMNSPGMGGSFTPPRSRAGTKGAEITAQAGGPEKMRDVLLHEGQHGVQNFENFARGANLDQFPVDKLRQDAFEDASRKIQGLMDRDPDAASSFRARNRYLGELKTKYGSEWGALATDRELGALDMLESDLMLNTRTGRALLDADWSRSATDTMPEEFWHKQAVDKYKSVAGEAEARLVQSRRDLTPEERRSRPPWLDYDIPEKDQIVRFGDK